MLYEALKKSMNRDHSKELAKDLAEARKKKKKRRDSPKMPPRSPPYQPPPSLPPAGPSGASGSSQVSSPPLLPSSTNQGGQSQGSAAPSSSKTAASAEYQAWTTIETRLRPSVSLTPADLQMDDEMDTDAQAQSSEDEDIENTHIPENNWASALASTYSPPLEDSLLAQTGDIAMFIDWFYSVDDSILMHNVSKPLPLGGLPSQVIIQSNFFFNKNLEYLRFSNKGSRYALSILKMKAAYYPDVGLEQMVPDQIHISEGDRRAVQTHMWILSVVRIEVFSMYGYDYMKKIVLRQADLNEHIIAKRDFKYLYQSDFEDLYLLNLQDRYGVQMIMHFNEIHKFSDGTLQQIDEALDYRVKEFKVNRMNPGLNTRFWTRKDVDRSKEFMFAIQKRLNTRRIFCNLESFVGGRVRDGDYRLLERTE
uniref:Uncharacterized protein n=1 Tax=Tanacetum cinerariifolium TaxID=118510 RepID=A0A6L2KC44_TANCI|nr:hypothetical protein [Tanacetum cinerariifolium]